MVVVQDCDLFKNEQRREALLSIISDLPEYVCLVFVYDQTEYKSGGNTKLGKLLKQKAVTVHFQPQTQSDLNAWIRRRFKSHGKDISNDLAEYLSFLCGGLMTGLSGEIEKVAFYASGSNIQRSDIDAVADPVLDARVFEMTDAISQKNFQKAAQVLSDLFLMNTEPIMILSVLGRQLRQLWSARLVMENRRGDIAQLWEMRSSWQAQRLMNAARRFDLRWCRRAVVLCAETDLAMKSTGLSSRELLTDLLLKLAA
jgi:DNA polymerase-3 subunit delta